MSTDLLPTSCPNCGVKLKGRFCYSCGQDCGNMRLDLRAQLREATGQILGWDGSLLRTMRGLWRSPGGLALDYIRGRRKSYLHPARFCLISLALWTVTMKLANMDVLSSTGIIFGSENDERFPAFVEFKVFLTRYFDWLLFVFLPLRALFFQLAFHRSGHTVGACLVPVLFVSGFGSLVGLLLVGVDQVLAYDSIQLRPVITMLWTIRATRDFFGVGWIEATLKSIFVMVAHLLVTIMIIILFATLWLNLRS